MTVRLAAAADRLRVVALLRNSHQAAGFTFPFHAAYAVSLFLGHSGRDNACCIVLEQDGCAQGVLMAQSFQHPFGAGLWAKETVWWIEPDYRGRSGLRMLAAYEDWARGIGCVSIGMASLESNDVSGLYRRCGYAPAETHFIKTL